MDPMNLSGVHERQSHHDVRGQMLDWYDLLPPVPGAAVAHADSRT